MTTGFTTAVLFKGTGHLGVGDNRPYWTLGCTLDVRVPDSTAEDSTAELYLLTTLRWIFSQNTDSTAELEGEGQDTSRLLGPCAQFNPCEALKQKHQNLFDLGLQKILNPFRPNFCQIFVKNRA